MPYIDCQPSKWENNFVFVRILVLRYAMFGYLNNSEKAKRNGHAKY